MAKLYRPDHQTQWRDADPRDEYDRYNCAADSLAMALDFATLGGLRISGEGVRAMSDEPIPDPDSPGLNLEQMDEVAGKLRVVLHVSKDRPFTTASAYMASNHGLLISGLRGALDDYLGPNCGVFTGPHTVFAGAIRADGDWLIFDPLCKGPHWVPASAVRAFAEGFARRLGIYPNIYFAFTRAIPLIVG